MRLLFIIILLLLKSSVLNATSELLEKNSINHYINGDYDKYFSSIKKIINKYPSSALSRFYLLTLKIDKNIIPDFDSIYPVYRSILKRKNQDFFIRQILTSEIVNYLIDINKFNEAKKLVKNSGYIEDWNYAGPFNFSFYNDIDHNFHNIENSDIDDIDESEDYWKKFIYMTDYGWIPLKLVSKNKKGIIYTSTYFYLPKDMNIILWHTSHESAKLYIDQKLIFNNDKRKYHYYLNNIFKIKLQKGWHYLLVKTQVFNNYNFRCRLLTEKGYPVNGLKVQVKPGDIKDSNIISKRIYPKVYNYYMGKIENKTKKMLDYFKLSLLDFHYFNENRSIKNLHRYINIKKNNPFLNFLMGRLFYYRYNKNNKKDYLEKSRDFFNKVKNSIPHFFQVNRYLSKYHYHKSSYDKMYNDLKKMNKNKIYDLWGDYFNQIKWDFMKYRNYYQETMRSSKKHYFSYVIANHFSDFDINRSITCFTNQENTAFQFFNETDLLNIYLKQNNFDKFNDLLSKIYRNNRYNENYYYYKAIYEKKNKEISDGLNVLKTYMNLHLQYKSFKILKEYAQLCDEKRDFKNALRYYRKAYKIRPYDIDLYKRISYLSKNKMFVSLEDKYYKVNTKKIIKKAFNDINSDGNLIKMYLDLFIIKPFKNGGYTYLVHHIFKVLDEEGKEKFGEVKIPSNNSKIIYVKNYLSPDKVKEGLDYKEHNNNYYISMSDLKVGSVVEVCYQIFYRYNWLDYTKFFYFSPFSFQESDFEVENSIFVLVQDEDIPEVNYKLINGDDIEYDKDKKDDETVHVWYNKKAPKLKREFNSIPIMDLIPNIYLSSIPDWKTFYNWYIGKIQDKIIIDYNLENKILDMYEEAKVNGEFSLINFLKAGYYFIQKNINYSYDYLFYPENIDIIYSRKKGNTEEKTLLMYAFLKKLNIDCSLVLVRNNQYSKFDFNFVFPEAFNSILLYVPKQHDLKKNYYLDFSEKELPFNSINYQYADTKGFMINDNYYKFITTPGISDNDNIYEDYTVKITNDLAAITGKIKYSGLYNLNKSKYKDFISRERDIFECINSVINRIAILNYNITNLDNLNKDLIISFQGDLDAGNSISVIFDPFNLSKRYVSKLKRKTPLKIYIPLIKKIRNKIVINKDYILALKNHHLKNSFGEFKLSIKKDKNNIIIDRYLKILPQIIKTDKYKEFLEFCREIDNIEEIQLIFK